MRNFTKDHKKNLLASSLVGLVIAASSNANANNVLDNARLYVGAGLGYNKYNLSNDYKNRIENAPNNGSVRKKAGNVLLPVVGIKFQENYGVELGYVFHNKLEFDARQTTHNLHLRNFFVDVMGYMPVKSQIDLVGGVGIGSINIKEKSSVNAIGNGSKYTKFGLRAKIGAQYAFDNNWNVRALVGYQKVGNQDGKQSIKSIQSGSVDFTYLI